MNTKNKQNQKKNRRQGTLPEKQSKKQPRDWDMWEMRHLDLKTDHEPPEARLTR